MQSEIRTYIHTYIHTCMQRIFEFLNKYRIYSPPPGLFD